MIDQKDEECYCSFVNTISIIQGRLSPSLEGRFQFFPSTWMDEFPLAREMGFSAIDWFLDRGIHGFDPIHDVWSKQEVLKEIDQARTILPISSIDCGPYPLFGEAGKTSLADFLTLLPALIPRLESKIITIPLVEKCAPKTEEQKQEAHETLRQITELAHSLGARIALETELPAEELASFIDSFNSPAIGVCYDTGNTTTFGFDCPNEIRTLNEKIFSVHLKDRKVGSTQSLLLGTGDVAFDECFRALKEIYFTGPYTLQAWRGEDYLQDAKDQLAFVKTKLS